MLADFFPLVPFVPYRTIFLHRNPLYAFIVAIDIGWVSKLFIVVTIRTLCEEQYNTLSNNSFSLTLTRFN